MYGSKIRCTGSPTEILPPTYPTGSHSCFNMMTVACTNLYNFVKTTRILILVDLYYETYDLLMGPYRTAGV